MTIRQNILITGASSGLGEGMAREYARMGRNLALCLSGGGYRAMLFHVGMLWRLNEVGLLSQMDRISSVSGGSIAAGAAVSGLAGAPDTIASNSAVEIIETSTTLISGVACAENSHIGGDHRNRSAGAQPSRRVVAGPSAQTSHGLESEQTAP